MKRLYSEIRKHLNPKQKGQLSRLVNFLSGKPIIKKDSVDPDRKFPQGEKGGVLLTADFEMAWAWRYTKTGADYLKKGRQERKNFPKIIDVLEEYQIPVTFATVGHLFLENCNKEDHEWMHRIPHFDDHWKFTSGDWFDHDPHSNYKEAPEWYAPDLIRQIFTSKAQHELALHTFSHIDFSDKNCPPEVAEDEIKASNEAAIPFGIQFKSFVFPGGTYGNYNILKRNGIRIYRKNTGYDLAYPYRDLNGMLITPSSAILEFDTRYNWAVDYYAKRIYKLIKKAIQTNTIAHLWFHPSLEPVFIKNLFPKVFEYINRHREKGELWIGTMQEIAEHINKNKLI